MPEKSYQLPADLYQGGEPWGNLTYPAIVKNKEQVPRFYQAIVELEENRPPYELYHMNEDPGQRNNVYGLPRYETERKRLEKELENWRAQTGDTILHSMIETFKKE